VASIGKVENATLIIDDELYKQAQDNEIAHLRMVEGAEKYGKSWAEVDLKTDLLEELYDCLNYPLMIAVRLHHNDRLSAQQWETIALFRDKVKELIAEVESFIPSFEGPTSAEYVDSK